MKDRSQAGISTSGEKLRLRRPSGTGTKEGRSAFPTLTTPRTKTCPWGPRKRGANERCASGAAGWILLAQTSIGATAFSILGMTMPSRAQEPVSSLIQRIDAAVHNRYEHVLGFTDVEHYAVLRGADQAHPAAAMTVKVTYRKGVGKSYVILSRSGSGVIQKFGLQPLLDNEQKINDPATAEQSWFTSANYEMTPHAENTQNLSGRRCVPVAIKPKHKAPNMIDGTLWVDAADGSIVRVEGIASQSPSIFAGKTKMLRDYAPVGGYAMATHARAESDSKLFGKTVVTIDYGDYHLQAR